MSPAPIGRNPGFLSSRIKRLAVNVFKLLASPVSDICIFLIQILLTKFGKDFRKSTDKEPNECEVKILRQSTSKTEGPHSLFVFTVAFKTSSSLLSSKTTLCLDFFRPYNKALLLTVLALTCFASNIFQVLSDSVEVPLLMLLVSNLKVPFSFSFCINCLNLEETFSMFTGALLGVNLLCLVLLLSKSSRKFPFSYSFSLREKCPYSDLIWSAFSRIRTEYGEIWGISVFNPNAGKCGPE